MNPDELLAELYGATAWMIDDMKHRFDEERRCFDQQVEGDYWPEPTRAMAIHAEVGKYLGLRKVGL